jgi:DNA-binding transcriptional LysR family regulator
VETNVSEVDWDDLKLFYHVAAEGGLAGASMLTGISPPTIGRRMLALERTMGRTLFIRSQQGYRLAPDGQFLMEHVQTLRKTVADITQWHGDAFTLPIVSIAGDIWLSGFVAENTAALRHAGDAFRLCCKRWLPEDDLTFRRGTVALFAAAPKSGNFAVRRTVDVAYCAYRAVASSTSDDLPWISIGTEVALSAVEKWVFRHREGQIHTWTNAPELLPKLIAGGAGRGVLPAYLGDSLPALMREGDLIEDLTHPIWLAVNDDDRQRPEVRITLDRLAALLKSNEALFSGNQPRFPAARALPRAAE